MPPRTAGRLDAETPGVIVPLPRTPGSRPRLSTQRVIHRRRRRPRRLSVVARRITPVIEGDGEPVRVRLTVVDPARVSARADVELRAAPGTRLGAVVGALRAAVGLAGDGEPAVSADGAPMVFVDGEPVAAAVLGVPPLLDGAVLTLGRAGGVAGRHAGTAGGLAEVHVVAGPDAGARFPLPPRPAIVGRGPEATVRIADPDVSRAHAEIARSGVVVTVRDLGSTNGTCLGGRLVG